MTLTTLLTGVNFLDTETKWTDHQEDPENSSPAFAFCATGASEVSKAHDDVLTVLFHTLMFST